MASIASVSVAARIDSTRNGLVELDVVDARQRIEHHARQHRRQRIHAATATPGATSDVPRLKMIGWLTWSWYSVFILSAQPFLVADRIEKGWSSARQPFPHTLSPNDYTRGDLPCARRHCTDKAGGDAGLLACTTPSMDSIH